MTRESTVFPTITRGRMVRTLSLQFSRAVREQCRVIEGPVTKAWYTPLMDHSYPLIQVSRTDR